MAISTLYSHIDTAIQMQKRRDSAYLVFGGTDAWENEGNPPNESKETTEINKVIGYKKLKQFSLARPLEKGETKANSKYPVIMYKGMGWALIPTAEAYEQGARWLYAEADLFPDEFPLGMYRQVGVHLGVEPKSGITKLNLKPIEVKNKGVLHFYENREPQNRTSSVYVLEQFMLKV